MAIHPENIISETPRIIVVQDNAQRSITIREINEAAAILLGYMPEELKEMSLSRILGKKTQEFLEEMLEYESDAPDLQEVLEKQRECRFRHKMNEEIVFPVRVSRVSARDANHWFELAIPDERNARARQQLRDFLRLNLEGRQILDEATSLPDRATAEAFFDLLRNYLSSNSIEGALAVVRIDRFEKSIALYGAQPVAQLLVHAANCCKRTLGNDDIVMKLNDKMLGIFLLDISRDSVRVVLNRLRWLIRSHRIVFGGKSDFSVTVTISFDMITSDSTMQTLLQCEEALGALDENERNGLIELAA